MRINDVQSGSDDSGIRALILTADKFEDLELLVPYFRLLEEGVTVDIAAPTLDEISGERGYRMMPDMLISSVEASDYDILMVPGGFSDGAPATVRVTSMRRTSRGRSFNRENRLRPSVMGRGCSLQQA